MTLKCTTWMDLTQLHCHWLNGLNLAQYPAAVPTSAHSQCRPALAGKHLFLWVNNLSKEAKSFLSPVCPYLFSLVERAGIWICAWRSREWRVCFLIEMGGVGRRGNFFKLFSSFWENLRKPLSLKWLFNWGFWCNWIQCSGVFLWRKRVLFFLAMFCALLQQTGIFFPWTSEYGLLPFSCLRIWNISSLSSSAYALLVPV